MQCISLFAGRYWLYSKPSACRKWSGPHHSVPLQCSPWPSEDFYSELHRRCGDNQHQAGAAAVWHKRGYWADIPVTGRQKLSADTNRCRCTLHRLSSTVATSTRKGGGGWRFKVTVEKYASDGKILNSIYSKFYSEFLFCLPLQDTINCLYNILQFEFQPKHKIYGLSSYGVILSFYVK